MSTSYYRFGEPIYKLEIMPEYPFCPNMVLRIYFTGGRDSSELCIKRERFPALLALLRDDEEVAFTYCKRGGGIGLHITPGISEQIQLISGDGELITLKELKQRIKI